MDHRKIGMRLWGLPVTFFGISMVVISGELLPFYDPVNASDEIGGLLLRGGFGMTLIGILSLFLFSVRMVPRDVSVSFMKTQGKNLARLAGALNLHGRGIYFPPVGRLKEDRVYIPLESHDLPIPDLADDVVLSVGSTGPSMGISIIPPGKEFVDTVERMTGRTFSGDSPRDGTESLERLSKGTGLFRSIEMKDRGRSVILNIRNDRTDDICGEMWKKHPSIHSQVGCPLCSSVLCATARIVGSPLRISSAKRDDDKIIYELEKVTR